MKWWEKDTLTSNEISESFDIGILLGGYSNPAVRSDSDFFYFNDRANRLTNTIELYKEGKIGKILITGGAGNPFLETPREAAITEDLLIRLGIPVSDIIIEDKSRNTHENSIFTADILREKYPEQNYLLITSAFHMRRSKACFDKAGLKTTAFSVDFIAEKRHWTPKSWLLPDSMALSKWEMLIKEWVGYVMYWLKGYL